MGDNDGKESCTNIVLKTNLITVHKCNNKNVKQKLFCKKVKSVLNYEHRKFKRS